LRTLTGSLSLLDLGLSVTKFLLAPSRADCIRKALTRVVTLSGRTRIIDPKQWTRVSIAVTIVFSLCFEKYGNKAR
jgi:hypothetical protein